MKRLTIAMSDYLYGRLLGYAADQSKSQMKRLSLGETVRSLVSARLDEIGYGVIKEDGEQMPGVFFLKERKIVRAFRHRTIADEPDYLKLVGAG